MRSTRTLILVEVALAVAIAAVLNFLSARMPINVAGGSVNLCMLPLAVVALRRGWIAGAVAGALFGTIDVLLEPFFVHPLQLLLDYPLPYLLFGLGVGLFSGLYNKAAERDWRKAMAGAGGAAGGGGSGTAGGTAGEGISGDANRSIGRFVISSTLIIIVAIAVGGLLRYIPHVLSGVVYFAEYAADFFAENPSLLQPGAMDSGLNAWIYSLVYNISYLLPSVVGAAICSLVVMPALAMAVPVPARASRGKLAKAA